MLPGFTQFQLFVPAPLVTAGGDPQWILYAAAATVDELENHVRTQRIPTWAILVSVCVKAGPAAPALHLVKVDG